MAKNKVVVKLNSVGVKQLLNGPEVQALLGKHANRIAASANAGLTDSDGYKAKVWKGFDRARGDVRTTDQASREHNAETNALLKGL